MIEDEATDMSMLETPPPVLLAIVASDNDTLPLAETPTPPLSVTNDEVTEILAP
jgi:hypothetical protein